MRKFGRPYLAVLKCTLSQQTPGAGHTEYWQALLTLGHPFLPLCLSLLSSSSLHRSQLWQYTCLWAIWYPSKKNAQQSSWCGGRSDPHIPQGCTTHIHCVTSLWKFEVGRNTGCVWPKGHHMDPCTAVKGKHTIEIHSRTTRKWHAEQHTATNHAGKSELHSHAPSMHKLVSARKGPITN